MMREIKFRGKDKDSGEWICGSLLCLKADNIQIWRKEKDGTWNYVVDPATVGQYTGLRDAKGVEIYEGDVVCLWSGSKGIVRIGTYDDDFLEYSPTICGVYCNEIGTNNNYGIVQNLADSLEVIGNVHDAPELLKK